jgi:large-conductance mechanosensitive channel
MQQDLETFDLRGNVVDLAVGIIIGAARAQARPKCLINLRVDA